jgi:hypothetical protein
MHPISSHFFRYKRHIALLSLSKRNKHSNGLGSRHTRPLGIPLLLLLAPGRTLLLHRRPTGCAFQIGQRVYGRQHTVHDWQAGNIQCTIGRQAVRRNIIFVTNARFITQQVNESHDSITTMLVHLNLKHILALSKDEPCTKTYLELLHSWKQLLSKTVPYMSTT